MWLLKDEEMAAPPVAGNDARARGAGRDLLRRHPQVVTSAGYAPR
jgi:hypothetical protein